MKNIWSLFKEECRKFREISSLKEKGYYIWDYYRLWIAGIAAVLTIGSVMIYHFVTVPSENWIYVMFANTFAEVGKDSDLYNGFVEYSGYDLKEKKIEFNNNAYFDYSKNVIGNSYYEAFVTHTEAGTLDVITMEKEALESLGESGRLLDLNREECKEIKEKYEDRFLYSIPYDTSYSTEPVPVGIDISDSILMSEYNIYTDSCALGIGAKTAHLDSIMDFLDYIFEEN